MSKTILVVDDDEDLRSMTGDLLREGGYNVLEADNGASALEHIEARPPELVLLDMRMPVMNGGAFVKLLREKHGRGLPIVVFTAASDAHRVAREVKADAWLGKPCETGDLFAAIRRLIGEP
jgi:two-component system OmpR family response regulator